MQKKTFKYILTIVVLAIVGYNSVYFKKLSDVKQGLTKQLDATQFATKLWKEQMPAKIESAIELTQLIQMIKQDPEKAFAAHSNAMAIGNYRYSIVKAIGVVSAVNEDDIQLEITGTSGIVNVKIATEFIYGNAIRDASQLVDVKDFTNSTDLSNISEALNAIVKKQVLPNFIATVKKGNKVSIVAAVEINKAHVNLNELELIPLQIKIVP
jgi:predicted lipoprotein